MKILQINKFHYKKGGSETYYFALSDKLKQEGHDVIHFSMNHVHNMPSPTSDYFIAQINYEDTSFFCRVKNVIKIFWNQEAYTKLTQLIKDQKPDIAHIHNFSHQLSPSILFALKKQGVPIVMTVHDYKVISPNYTLFADGKICDFGKHFWKYLFCGFKPSFLLRFILVLEAYFTRLFSVYKTYIDQYISPSQFMKEKLIQNGIDSKKISQVYNFFDVKEKKFESNDYGYVLFAGRLSQEKGIFTLLASCKDIAEIPVYIVGDGPLMQEAKEYVKKQRLENVVFFGYKEGQELEALYTYAACIVIPSQWYENNPYAIIEAFSYAKPVIGTNLGGIPELVQDGKTGHTFALNDTKQLSICIDKLMSHEKLRKEMGLQARVFAQNTFDAAHHVKRILAIYQNVIHS